MMSTTSSHSGRPISQPSDSEHVMLANDITSMVQVRPMRSDSAPPATLPAMLPT